MLLGAKVGFELVCFDMLVYTKMDLETPKQWEDSDARHIENSSEVRLRSFNTKVCVVSGGLVECVH